MFKIRFIGDPVLRRETEEISVFDHTLERFIQGMIETMHDNDGVGLAAPQIGHSKKVIVVDISTFEEGESPKAFINPEIVDAWGESVVEEGCLSIPDIREEVSRPERIRITYHSPDGQKKEEEFDGWMARVLQHEIDHINGVLFLDLISPIKRKLLFEQGLVPERY